MKTETIKENTDYLKINKSYIVNRNDDEYKSALIRRKNILKQKDFEQRLSLLEDKLDKILHLLENS